MNDDPHTQILDTYFWRFVDHGDAPADTPLFTGIYEGDPLARVIATEFGLHTRTKPNPPSRLPGRRSRYEPRHLSGDYRRGSSSS